MKKFVLVALAVVFVGLIFAGCRSSQSPQQIAKIDINGSTTVFPIAQKAAEVYMNKHQDVTISVEGTGSGNGIAALIDKSTDIADASREIKQEEIDKAKANGVDPYEIPIALDALSVIVNPQNPVNALSADQVRNIFIGKITNWKDVGGPEMPIVVVTRDTSSGTYGAFMELALKKGDQITDRAIVQSSSQTVKNTIATTKGAIGYDGLGYVDSSVKAISYDGVMPSKETAINKSYKLSRHLYMYTNGSPTGAVKDFIDFVLGPDGQSIVDEVGFIKIK
jgi:phosphate transport system substrate-binding protein